MKQNDNMNGAPVRILVSTQSGRAKACARRTCRILREDCGVSVGKVALFDEDPWFQSQISVPRNNDDDGTMVILFVSTTGDGEHTDTIQNTWRKLLVKTLSGTQLQHLSFFIFCLGDRAYGDQFCAAGRKLIVRLRQLGAHMMGSPGYGDDGSPGGVLADLDEWMTTQLLQHFGRNRIASDKAQHPVTAPYKLTFGVDDPSISSDRDDFMLEFIQRQAPLAANSSCLEGLVVENKRLTAADWYQDTRHIQIEVSAPYQAGDVASIMPVNDPKQVERFLQVLPATFRKSADQIVQVRYESNTTMHPGVCYEHWPRQCTLRQWLKFCADFGALPEREDLRVLSRYCSNGHEMCEEQRDRLLLLSDPQGAALYNDYILREKRSWVDVFHDFDSLRDDRTSMTMGDLLGLFSPIRPRDFSIASSPKISSCEYIELCVAVVEGNTRLQRKFRGFCSTYLATTTENHTIVRLWIRRGTFPSTSSEAPVVCIASGTGIAPMRSLLHERLQGGTNNTSLVFGCRNPTKDYYYKDEWSGFEEKEGLKVFNAFSQDSFGRKTYVQDILDQLDSITSALLSQGYILIAGNPRMARCVKEKLVEILIENSGGDARAAKKLFNRLQKAGHVSIEAWG